MAAQLHDEARFCRFRPGLYCLTFTGVLSPKPWKLETILRLFMRLFICMCAGWLLLSVLYAKSASGSANLKVFVVAGVAGIFLAGALFLLRKPWSSQTFLTEGVIGLIVFYTGFVLATWVQRIAGPLPARANVTQMVVAMLSLQGAVLILVTLMLREQKSSWPAAFGFRNDLRRALLLGVIAGCLFLPVGYLLQRVSAAGIEQFTKKKPAEQEAVETIRDTPAPTPRLLLGLVTILLAPLGEETLFRGILYSTIKQAGFPRIAFWVSSILFGLIHANMGAFLPLVVLAMILALIYEKTDNLLAPIAAHATFNAVEFTFMLIAPAPA
jgi:membrane protease YdiL (CAAX protease family)